MTRSFVRVWPGFSICVCYIDMFNGMDKSQTFYSFDMHTEVIMFLF